METTAAAEIVETRKKAPEFAFKPPRFVVNCFTEKTYERTKKAIPVGFRANHRRNRE